MKKSIGKTVSYARKNFTRQSGQMVNTFTRNARIIRKDITKAVNKIDFNSMMKGVKKTSRLTIKSGNKMLNRGMKNFRRSDFYKSVSGFPKYTTAFSLWSLIQFKKLKKSVNKGYFSSRKWIVKTYPKVESYAAKKNVAIKSWMSVQLPVVGNFIQENYTKVGSFVLTTIPVYRAILGK